jgi:hypothetical protein
MAVVTAGELLARGLPACLNVIVDPDPAPPELELLAKG